MIITTDLIMSWNPCSEYPHERVQKLVGDGLTPLEVCDLNIPAVNKLWVLLREEVLDDATLRLLEAAWAEMALMHRRITDDERSWNFVRVVRLYALGEATDDELAAAGGAVRTPAWGAATTSAWAATGYAASAARSATGRAASAAAWCAANAAAREAQVADIRRMLEESNA